MAAAPINLAAISFNQHLAGTSFPEVTVHIERDRVRFLSNLLGETDPVHHDVASAHAAGHDDLLAPPSFPAVVETLADEERRRRGLPDLLTALGADLRFLLHGNESYVFHGNLFAGDEIEVIGEVVGFKIKKGGLLQLALLRTRMLHSRRGLLITATRTLLHRLG